MANIAKKQAENMIGAEKRRFQAQEKRVSKLNAGKEFQKKMNMNDAEFAEFQKQANSHTLTFDDVYFLLNRDKVSKNVADNTKTDMLNQMKKVRDIPQSASNANSPGKEATSPDDKLFNVLKDLDSGADDLFS